MKNRELELNHFLEKACPKAIVAYEANLDTDKNLKMRFTIKQARQKNKNKIIRRELKNLASKVNFKILLIKGLVLDEELYTSEKIRIFSDVDLLISENDVDEMMHVLEYCGYERKIDKIHHYKYTGDYILNYINDVQALRLQINHIVYNKIVNGETIVIELHTSFAGMRYPSINYSDVFKTSVPTVTIASGIYKMNPTNMILYQMCHFCKHIGNYVFYNSEHLNLDMRDVHEIALLLDKYKENIEWNVFIDSAQKWGLIGSVNLCFSILEGIYSNLVDKDLIDLVKGKTIECHDEYAYSALIDDISSLPAQKILNLEIREVVYNGRIDKNALICYLKHDYTDNFLCQTNELMELKVGGIWNEEKIIFDFNLRIEEPNIIHSLMVTLGSQNYISGCENFVVEKTNHNRCILKNEWSEPIVDDDVIIEVSVDEYSLKCKMAVSWKYLGIVPSTHTKIPFNIKVYFKDVNGNISMQSIAHTKYFNFYKNSCLELL